jgi:uncharacterized repeat protein (TIGR02543 family)
MSPSKRKEHYCVNDGSKHIDKVTINGNIFTHYSAFSFLWEKSYIKEPVRSGDGSIGNLNSYATFLTPHLKIDFGLMSIDSYRKLMQLIYSGNEFLVTCYDVVNNKDKTNKMYFHTEEMPKLWTIVDALNGDENAVMLLGVQDYTVEMIGTNESLEVVEVLYYDNNGVLINEATQSVNKGTEVVINYDFVAPTGYRFNGDWKNELGTIVRNGEAIRIADTIKLYAQVVPTDEYTLSFAYGNGNVLYSQTLGAINSITIKENETINQAIARANITLDNDTIFTFPENGTGGLSVEYEKSKYTIPYEFKGWFWTTEPNDNTNVTSNTLFDYNLNRILYQIYKPKQYKITFNSNDSNINFDTINVPYGQNVALPSPRKTGYTFGGWFTSSDFKDGTRFGATMPPYSVTLYAKWVKNE